MLLSHKIACGNMEKCVAEIKIGIINDMLRLNDDKTELFIFALQRQVDVFNGLSFCHYQMRNIRCIRKHYIPDYKKIVHALVTSRLVYTNVLLYGLHVKTTNVLQRVQNCAARLIMRFGRRDHMTPMLCEL